MIKPEESHYPLATLQESSPTIGDVVKLEQQQQQQQNKYAPDKMERVEDEVILEWNGYKTIIVTILTRIFPWMRC